jgi:prepilin signal peptidase PulO-like enzyme (type II secretory pathway)
VPPLDASLWTALGFAVGMGVGGAVAARLAGRSAVKGRCCPACGASLSLLPLLPFLSWFGAVPRCRNCGWEAGRSYAIVELAALLIGLGAIFMVAFPAALYVALAGWAILLVLLLGLRRFG